MPEPHLPQPWERQRGESAKAYAALRSYLNLGASRSHAKVAQETGKDKTLIARWSRQWSWVTRAQAYDEHLEREFRDEMAAARRDLARRHLRIGDATLGVVVQRLQSLDPHSVRPHELAKLLDVASAMQRRAATETPGDQNVSDDASREPIVQLVDEIMGRKQ